MTVRSWVDGRLDRACKTILKELRAQDSDTDEKIAADERAYPANYTIEDFFEAYVWVVYDTGLKSAVVGACWERISQALRGFDVGRVAAERDAVLVELLTVFNNKVKANNVITMAARLANRPQDWTRLQRMSAAAALDEVGGYPGIGPDSRYHLVRDLGWDVATHIGFTKALAESLRTDPDTLMEYLARESKLRVSTIDSVVWRWSCLYSTQREGAERFRTLIGLSA